MSVSNEHRRLRMSHTSECVRICRRHRCVKLGGGGGGRLVVEPEETLESSFLAICDAARISLHQPTCKTSFYKLRPAAPLARWSVINMCFNKKQGREGDLTPASHPMQLYLSWTMSDNSRIQSLKIVLILNIIQDVVITVAIWSHMIGYNDMIY